MKSTLHLRLPVWLAAVLATGATDAQTPEPEPQEFKIKNIRQLYRQAPNYSGTSGSLGGTVPAANRAWLMIEVDFSSRPDWADDVQMKYYVLMGTGRETKLFSDSVTHVHVKKRSSHYSAMFLHPNVLDRYGAGRVQAVAVQLFHRGRLVDQASSPPSGARWWEQFTPVTGHLLRPEDTPWSVIAHERFEAIRKDAR
jgi:hypothetical protein